MMESFLSQVTIFHHVILKFLLISFDIVKEELHGDFFLPLFNFKSISEVYLWSSRTSTMELFGENS